MNTVIKRDGRKVQFNRQKIQDAIDGAFQDVSGRKCNDNGVLACIMGYINAYQELSDTIEVEKIQDIVERSLMEMGYYNVAKAYIRYRYEHELTRQKRTDYEVLGMIEGVDDYWSKENSNKDVHSVSVQRDYLAGILSTDIAKRYIFPKEVVEAHEAGIVHQHDMDYMAQNALTNCELINLNDMLQNGTVINKVHINKPHRLITAMTLTTQIMASVCAHTYGGQTITLTHLAPFVRDSYNIFVQKYKDAGLDATTIEKLAKQDLDKEIADAVQTFNYQISTLFTLNGQAPFCSVAMYINETNDFKEELILLILEFLKQRKQGMPNREGIMVTQAFPKLLYFLDEDNYKPGTKYWDITKKAIECSSCRLTPDYISVKNMKKYKINGNGDGDVFPCMGCRSFLHPDPTGNGYNNIAKAKDYDGKPKYYGRFNCGVSSINLPDIAFACDGDMNKFWQIFDERMEILHKGLQTRINRISKVKASAAPILWMDGAMARLEADETLDKLVHNLYASISIGYVGLYETVKILTGKSHTTPEGYKVAVDIMNALNDKANQWKAEEKVAYSVYSSPAESLCYKFATKTRERYPEKFQELFGNKKYFENSYHIASSEPIDPFEKIKFEGKFQPLAPGGNLSYIESVDLSNNIEALYPIIEAIYNDIMYCEINIKTSYCHVCGLTQTIDVHKDEKGNTWWECKNCGNTDTSKMDVAARTCGYVGTNFWNDGKTQEIASRYIHLDDHDIEEQ